VKAWLEVGAAMVLLWWLGVMRPREIPGQTPLNSMALRGWSLLADQARPRARAELPPGREGGFWAHAGLC